MRKFYLTSLLGVFSIFSALAQLANWPLTSDGNPANVDVNVTAGVFKNGTGLNTLSFGTSGASCSGWTTNASPDTADYYQITIAPNAGYKVKVA